MILSSRANPPKTLKLHQDRLLSIKSYLPSSPIPSPSLPSILPRHGKKPPKLNSRKIVRGLLWLSFAVTLYYIIAYGSKTTRSLSNWTFSSALGKTYEIVEAAELPDHATPLALTDHKGRHYWTISIPSKLRFPLSGPEYADVCSQVEELAQHVAGNTKDVGKPDRKDYYKVDHNFIDIDEAQAKHFLPSDHSYDHKQRYLPVCQKSLTYVLDATDAGLGSALLGMWLSYSMAEREGREFFIDDTNFPYGNYSTFFNTMPTPKCRPPPSTQRVPCLHQAKHLVISAATTSWQFGEAFHEHFTQRQIFDMARNGYEALFKLRNEDDEYVTKRIAELRKVKDNDEYFNGLVGIHIRRGDRHPFEFAYSQGYIPPETYMKAVRKQVGRSDEWHALVASDDADMYDHIELPGIKRAQERISLASKKKIQGGGLGWEGGFFKDVFWSLGLPLHAQQQKRIGSPTPTMAKPKDEAKAAGQDHDRDYKIRPTKAALQFRELLGRGYLLDLAVLAQTDRVVCGVSSNACRILAVMMGWDRAFVKREWTNVDGEYKWRALDY